MPEALAAEATYSSPTGAMAGCIRLVLMSVSIGTTYSVRGCLVHYAQQPCIGQETPFYAAAKDFFCQHLAELHPFLVKGVDVPGKALEHDLVLKVGQQCTQGLGRQPICV